MNCPAFLLATSFVVALSSCTVEHGREYTSKTEHQKIARDKSEMARTEFSIAAGGLTVSGGTKELMEGDFTYGDPSFQPQIRYNNSSFRSLLELEQRPNKTTSGNVDSKWDVHLNEEVAMDLKVKMGAGEAKLDVGKLNLRSVEVEVGAGEVKLDLRGTPKHDYDVRIRGGVGEATVWVPREARVTADAAGGLGDIEVHGFNKRDGHYENEPTKDAQVRIHLDVKGGIGSIRLFSE